MGGMQGKLIIAVALAVFGADAAICSDTVKRLLPCKKAENVLQRQPQANQPQPQPQQRRQSQGCPIVRAIPPVVDQTPMFIL